MPDSPLVIAGVLDGGPGDASVGLGPELGPLVFVVGAFDGLHRGHAYLLAQLRAAAARHHARPGVITFDHHPDEILVGAAPPVLCDPSERLVRFGRAGVDVVVVQHFDAAVRMTTYQDFVAAISRRVELAGFLMTPDAAFGHERHGTPAALAELGRSAGFALDVVAPLELDGRPVRSTEIRSAIAAGDLQGARRLLGRSVAVVGRVSSGRVASGRVAFELPVALPPAGRYRVEVEPAWVPGLAQSDRPVAGIGTVRADGSLSVDVRGRAALPAADRIRIRFVGPA
jgi:riboflavin kinase / FMN adenylyltransferase